MKTIIYPVTLLCISMLIVIIGVIRFMIQESKILVLSGDVCVEKKEIKASVEYELLLLKRQNQILKKENLFLHREITSSQKYNMIPQYKNEDWISHSHFNQEKNVKKDFNYSYGY